MTYSNKDSRYMHLAGCEAGKSELTYKHGCIAVVSGKIVAKGYNNYRTYSRDGMISNTCSCHAEIDVLRKCRKLGIKKKISLYIARISSENTLTLSKPCVECHTQMKKFDIKRVIYSDLHGTITKREMNNFLTNVNSSGQKAIQQKRVALFTI